MCIYVGGRRAGGELCVGECWCSCAFVMCIGGGGKGQGCSILVHVCKRLQA